MQAEFSKRGNGYIMSPIGESDSPQKKKPQASYDTHSKLCDAKEKLSTASILCISHAKISSKALLKKLLSAGIAVGCLIAVFNIFAFATGIYINNERLTANSKESFLSALSDAKTIAGSYGINNFDISYSTAPVISFRNDVCSREELRDKILLSSGKFIKGCSLYIENNKIFDTENYALANDAVKEYISSYSMNGEATLSTEPEYRECIIPKTIVSTKEQCIEQLRASDCISVVSVVNATSTKVVPFETITESDNSLFLGETATVTEGKNGNICISEETIYKNGEAQSSRISSEKITVTPVNRVVKVGTKYKKVLESGLFYPLQGVLSSPFGERWGNIHEGIDIAVAEGTPVKAAECGKVVRVSENAGGYGKLIQIDHGYGVETVYAHLSEIQVTEGQSVSPDTVIGLSGNTGRSTGPHLHFEIVESGTPIDPLKYLK